MTWKNDFLLALTLVLIPGYMSALTIEPSDFESLQKKADLVFIGEITSFSAGEESDQLTFGLELPLIRMAVETQNAEFKQGITLKLHRRITIESHQKYLIFCDRKGTEMDLIIAENGFPMIFKIENRLIFPEKKSFSDRYADLILVNNRIWQVSDLFNDKRGQVLKADVFADISFYLLPDIISRMIKTKLDTQPTEPDTK